MTIGQHTRRRTSEPSAGVPLFSFPNPVNEVSARLVAGGVVVMCVLTIGLRPRWATASSPTASWPGC